MFATFWHDLRHGGRMLLRNPGFAVIAFASIGIGVGANAAIFSLADGLVLRPLGVANPAAVFSIVGTSQERGLLATGVSYPDYVDIRERTRTFDSVVAYRNVVTGFDARPGQPAVRTIGVAISGNGLDAMQVQPAIGRFFRAEEDDVAGRDAVVVLDHRTWRERFAADPAAIGRLVRIANTDFTVIGVTAESFKGLDVDVWPTFYVPLAMLEQAQPEAAPAFARREARTLDVKGRLRPDATLGQARDDIARIGRELAAQHADTNRDLGLAVRTELEMRLTGLDAVLVVMMFVLAAAVLLVACANIAGLLTSRAPTRAREVALRLALGASRPRLIRQLLTESVMLAAGGAVIGLAIAYGGVQLFREIEFPTEVPLKLSFELDRRVLSLGLIVAFASAVLSSLIPAWQATRQDLMSTVKAGPGRGGRTNQWGRQTLVSVQVALTLVLLTVAASLYTGFNARIVQGPGYRTDRLLLMRFDQRLTGYDADRSRQFYRLLKEQAQSLPGVVSVALTSMVPMKTDTLEAQRVVPEGVRLPGDASDVRVRSSRVDEGYFPTLGIQVVAGRGFESSDREDTRNVAVINQTFADRYWPRQTVVGKRIRVRPFDSRGDGWFEVVGVVANSKVEWLGETPQEVIYLPYTQSRAVEHTLILATRDRPEDLVDPLRAAVGALDPTMPMFGIRTMEDLYYSRGVKVPTLIVSTVGIMGGMGLVLALVGLYGLVSYAVSSRTREIGIRIAVGARPWSVLTMMLRRGLVVTMMGIGLGGLASLGASRLLAGAIPGLAESGPGIYVAVLPALFAVTLLATYIPSRRAARVDPVRALRAE